MMEVTASVLAGQRILHGLQAVQLDVQVPGESPEVIGTVGIGSILGWSWLLPPYQ